MTGKIGKAIIKVSALVLVSTIVLIMGILYDYFTDIQISQQKSELTLASQGVTQLGMGYFEKLDIGNNRITLIDSDGTVIFDNKTDAKSMENHSEREEFLEAIESGYGESKRYSNTLFEKTIYNAKRLSDGTVLRISSTQLTVLSLVLGLLQPILIIATLAVFFSVVWAKQVSKKIVEPINALDLESPLQNDVYDELSPLLVRIDKQNKKINAQMSTLKQKNREINYITENVSDGIIILSEKGMVLSANKKASELLSCKEQDYYLDFCRNLDYKQAVEEARRGKNSVCTIKEDNKIYRIYASAIELCTKGFAVFLFISDVTDEEQAQAMRREFTANVSHELKTPLASILGSAEIIQNGIVKQEDIPHFVGKIHDEAERLLTLIQDIIKLSRLDEGALNAEFCTISLFDVCKSVKEQLSDKAKKKGISFKLSCDDSEIFGFPSVVSEMVYNLCDNAIAYNKENGEVAISVKTENGQTVLSVKDNGIGIEKKDCERIFERFYRADKSRSKETGGTGLGLSIVKHAAELHKAKINVESEVGIGTKVEIVFCER